MKVICKKCQSNIWVKNGKIKYKQRYKCKACRYNYTIGDKRIVYEKSQKELVIIMYLNNCGIRRIAYILQIPLSTVFMWIKKAEKIIEGIVKNRQKSEGKIKILELDELYTYIKNSLREIRKMEDYKENIYGYGMLWIGTDLKLFRLK